MGMILGTGLDIVEVARIADLAARHGERFLNRVYTPREQEYCLDKAARDQHLAGRFAVKEAVFKALGTGWAEGINWRQIEVLPGPLGAPAVALSGAAAERLRSMGGRGIHVSITHVAGLAAASAIVEG